MASEAAAIAASDYVNFYQAKKGFVSWLWTTDHKRIALLYLSSITRIRVIPTTGVAKT